MAFKDGLSAFLTTWSGVHTAFSFNQSNANTGTDTSHDSNAASFSQADISDFPNYGQNADCNPASGGDMDIYSVVDNCMMLYIPAALSTGVYGLWYNGGGTNAQGAFIKSESNGTTITLAISHNASGTNQDYDTYVITERGWVCVGFQFEDNSGNMAIWVNGVNVSEVARSYNLLYGSGNPGIGDNNGDGIPGWAAESTINGSGIIIANFIADNKNDDNTQPAGNGDSFYTDYYDEHLAEETITQTITAKGNIAVFIEKIRTVTAKASIKIFAQPRTISAKASIRSTIIDKTISAKAEIHMFVELFDSDTYKDAGETDADWDTATERVYLPLI